MRSTERSDCLSPASGQELGLWVGSKVWVQVGTAMSCVWAGVGVGVGTGVGRSRLTCRSCSL